MEYIIFGVLCIVVWRLSKIIKRKGKKFYLKIHFKIKERKNLTMKERWIYLIYRIDKILMKNIFAGINFVIFCFFMIISSTNTFGLLNFIYGHDEIRYGLIIWILWYVTWWISYCRKCNKAGNLYFTIFDAFYISIALSLISRTLIQLVANNPNWITQSIAIFFFVYPLYHLVLLILEIIQNTPIRSLIEVLFSVVIIWYTLIIFTMYNEIYPVVSAEQNVINFIFGAINNKSADISHITLGDIGKLNFDHMIQFISIIWEFSVIKNVLKL